MAAWSGATSAPRAPASTAMLHSVKRASIDSASMALPQNSTTWPRAPWALMRPMIMRIRSLEVVPTGSRPSTRMRMSPASRYTSVCVASTCSTSEVPMPNPSAPSAP